MMIQTIRTPSTKTVDYIGLAMRDFLATPMMSQVRAMDQTRTYTSIR